MCNPVAIGLVVAGTALQVNAQRRRQAAMENAAEDARTAEAMRQNALTEERGQVLQAQEQAAGIDEQKADLQAAANKREAAYQEATQLPTDQAGTSQYQPSTDSAGAQPRVVQETANAARDKANAFVNQVGNARARLSSFGDLNLGNQIRNTNAGQQLGMLGGFARGSAALLPGEVQAGMNKHAGDFGGQELLGAGLSLYGSAGAPALFGGGAAAAGAGAAGAAGAGAGTAAAGTAATSYAQPTLANSLSGLFTTKNIAPLFATNTQAGYLPTFGGLFNR